VVVAWAERQRGVWVCGGVYTGKQEKAKVKQKQRMQPHTVVRVRHVFYKDRDADER
jgi:hypothetical protein